MFMTNGASEAQPSAAARYRTKMLTFRRIKIISSFLCMTVNSPYTYGEFESPMWMDMLIELLCEPKRCKSTRADIKAWLKDDCFEKLIQQVRQATEKLRLSMATSGSESPSSSSSTSSPEHAVPMDLSANRSSSGIDEDSDSTFDIYTPNLYPYPSDAADAMMNVVNEELEPRDEPDYLDLSFPRSHENVSEMASNQNQSDPAVGLPVNLSGQQHYQHYHFSNGANPEYALHNEETWNSPSSVENWRTQDRFQHGVVKVKEEVRSDYGFAEPLAIAPWLFTRQNLDGMESENEAFVEANPSVYPVQVKTEVESDHESEYLDISYTRSATLGQVAAANLEQCQAPHYQSREGFDWQMYMAIPSPQPNYEYQGEDQTDMDQEEVLDYSVNKRVPVPSEYIPELPTAPMNYEEKSTQTLPVSNDEISRPLNANFPKPTDLLNDCNKVLTTMVEYMQNFENCSNGWDVVYRALSLVQATLKTRQQ